MINKPYFDRVTTLTESFGGEKVFGNGSLEGESGWFEA
jgi:hypothetical protein